MYAFDVMKLVQLANNASRRSMSRCRQDTVVAIHVVALVFLTRFNAVDGGLSADVSSNGGSRLGTSSAGRRQQAAVGVRSRTLFRARSREASRTGLRGAQWHMELGQLQSAVGQAGATGSVMMTGVQGKALTFTTPEPGSLPPVPKGMWAGDLRIGGNPILPPMTGPPGPPAPDPPVPPLVVPDMKEVGMKKLPKLPMPVGVLNKTTDYDFLGNVVAIKEPDMTAAEEAAKLRAKLLKKMSRPIGFDTPA